jgi:hypothetical protein
MAVSAATFGAVSTGLQLGGIFSGIITGVGGAIMAKRQADYAAKLALQQGKLAQMDARYKAVAMEQEALDFLVMADFTAGQSILDAQDAERVGRWRANVVRAAGERRRGDIRAQAGASGTVVDDTSTTMQLADDVYQTELAALAERYQGEAAAVQMRTEAEQARYKGRLGLSSARKGQQYLMAGANYQMAAAQSQAAGIRQEGQTNLIMTLMNSFLGPQTLSLAAPLIMGQPQRPTGGDVFSAPFAPANAQVTPRPTPVAMGPRMAFDPFIDPLASTYALPTQYRR